MTFIQLCINVEPTSSCCFDVDVTFFRHCVPAGYSLQWMIVIYLLEYTCWSLVLDRNYFKCTHGKGTGYFHGFVTGCLLFSMSLRKHAYSNNMKILPSKKK